MNWANTAALDTALPVPSRQNPAMTHEELTGAACAHQSGRETDPNDAVCLSVPQGHALVQGGTSAQRCAQAPQMGEDHNENASQGQ